LLFKLVGWDLDLCRGEEWDLHIEVVLFRLVGGSWNLSIGSVGFSIEDGLGGCLWCGVLLSVVLSSLDQLFFFIWHRAGDLVWHLSGLVGWDLLFDGVFLILELGDWDKFLHLEGLLLSEGLWNLLLDLVLLGIVNGLSVILGDGVWDLSGSGDGFLNPDDLGLFLVGVVLFVVVDSCWDLDFDFVVLVLVLNVIFLSVDLIWLLSGGGVWDSLVDGVWDLLVNVVGLGVVLDTVLNVTFLVLDKSWNLDFLIL